MMIKPGCAEPGVTRFRYSKGVDGVRSLAQNRRVGIDVDGTGMSTGGKRKQEPAPASGSNKLDRPPSKKIRKNSMKKS